MFESCLYSNGTGLQPDFDICFSHASQPHNFHTVTDRTQQKITRLLCSCFVFDTISICALSTNTLLWLPVWILIRLSILALLSSSMAWGPCLISFPLLKSPYKKLETQ